ncbi:MAG TPA: SCO family protein [Kofleriaceae bacterium]|nr:SCO family protein [Kofleriaceae bacterium]
MTATLLAMLGVVAGTQPAVAKKPESVRIPPIARNVRIDEKLGAKIPTDLHFVDATGAKVTLGKYLGGEKPMLLILAYHRCPMLCSLVIQSVAKAVADISLVPGEDFVVVTVSIDPRDTIDDAARAQERALAEIGAPGNRSAWPFLVGEQQDIEKLADAIGFRYAYDPRSKLYAHPAVVTVVAPDGMISRYLYGIDLSGRDVRLSLVDASDGKVGSVIDRILLTCFHYDPASRRYGVYVVGFFKIGGAILLLMTAIGGLVLWRIERRRRTRGD